MENIKVNPATLSVNHTYSSSTLNLLSKTYAKMTRKKYYQVLLFVLGLPLHLFAAIVYFVKKKADPYLSLKDEVYRALQQEGFEARIEEETRRELVNKYKFFNKSISESMLNEQVTKKVSAALEQEVNKRVEDVMRQSGTTRVTFGGTVSGLISNPLFFWITAIPGILMYLLIFIYSKPYLKYIFDRLVMIVFVIFGVTFLVFTILHLSPLDPATNILGESATQEQIDKFNQVYGLDQPYLMQLWNAFKGLATFDLGKSFTGNEDVASAIMRKLPVTLEIAVISLVIAVIMSIPSGIISATRQYSFFDYTFMLIVLIGLSIPDFWQGLVSILNFSIKLHWLPATYSPQNWLSLIMPALVLGTGLAASVARMTRSSTLEVIHQDFIVTARAKGLSERKVIFKHALGNALIPIVTVIGLQFGGMLGGAAVTEKVFNISGIGSFIVDKQFVPDIPGILAGVVYVAVTISLVNLIVDLLYAFLDPRIRSKMKDY